MRSGIVFLRPVPVLQGGHLFLTIPSNAETLFGEKEVYEFAPWLPRAENTNFRVTGSIVWSKPGVLDMVLNEAEDRLITIFFFVHMDGMGNVLTVPPYRKIPEVLAVSIRIIRAMGMSPFGLRALLAQEHLGISAIVFRTEFYPEGRVHYFIVKMKSEAHSDKNLIDELLASERRCRAEQAS